MKFLDIGFFCVEIQLKNVFLFGLKNVCDNYNNTTS